MGNMDIYNAVRSVPTLALKKIEAGRLKGKSDINPMWRIKSLTEQFGPCGIGWKYQIIEKRLEKGGGEEVAAFVDINLYVKVNGAWSEAIPGTGGSSFVANERNGLYTSDECFKMALTDAISVSCKALGFCADVYWEKDATKYTGQGQQAQPTAMQGKQPPEPHHELPQRQKNYNPYNPKPPAEQTEPEGNMTAFWASVGAMGFSEDDVHAEEGVDSIKGYSQRQLNALMQKMARRKQTA